MVFCGEQLVRIVPDVSVVVDDNPVGAIAAAVEGKEVGLVEERDNEEVFGELDPKAHEDDAVKDTCLERVIIPVELGMTETEVFGPSENEVVGTAEKLTVDKGESVC